MKSTIALLALAFTMASATASEYSCFGTEPFWDVKISKTHMSFSDFDDQPKVEEIISRETAAGVGDEYAFVVKSKSLSATVITGECNDGMSDNIYTHHVMVEGGDVFNRPVYGCCNKVK